MSNWIGRGNIPTLNADKVALANVGYGVAKEMFNQELFFHQALILAYLIDIEDHPKINVILPTRYGKSFTCALSALYRASQNRDKVAILAPNPDKSHIIMGEVTKALTTSSPIIRNGLSISDRFERLATQLSKSGISYPSGGSIHPISLHESRIGDSQAVGQGSTFSIIDESALVSDSAYSLAVRMELESINYKRIEISNPHQKNHFYKSINDDRNTNIWLDWKTAVEEGRYTEDTVQKIKESMTPKKFKIYVECKFLDDDEQGKVFNTQKCPKSAPQKARTEYLGIDVARHNDYTVIVGYSYDLQPTFFKRLPHVDLPSQKELIIDIWRELEYPKVNVDKSGIGWGLFEELSFVMGDRIQGFSFTNPFINLIVQNAEMLVNSGQVTLIDDPIFLEELEWYEKSTTPSGLTTYEASIRQSEVTDEELHDDCVIAFCLAVKDLGVVTRKTAGLGFIPLQ